MKATVWVLLAAWIGALCGLLVGAAAAGDRASPQLVLEQSIRCMHAYRKDMFLGLARELCQSNTWPFRVNDTLSHQTPSKP